MNIRLGILNNFGRCSFILPAECLALSVKNKITAIAQWIGVSIEKSFYCLLQNCHQPWFETLDWKNALSIAPCLIWGCTADALTHLLK
jgi:hypothetical protein